MGILATGNITLSSVNDACSVLLSRSACTITTAFDGSGADLSPAYTEISLVRGDVKVPISGSDLTIEVPAGVTYTVTRIDAGTQRISITAIPPVLNACEVGITLTSGGFSGKVMFSIAISRESSMLDWILDWENNKTTIGGEYILTPKIYAGSVTEGEDGQMNVTGVYMGPDSTFGAGIYGYLNNAEIFHLNSTGGAIGGWKIENGGISTTDGALQILSEGTVKSTLDDGVLAWALYKNGSASFAKGNVTMNADGSASFSGSITASSGTIAGWSISDGYISHNNLIMKAESPLIGVSPFNINSDQTSLASNVAYYLSNVVRVYGGVAMYYTNESSFGLVGYAPQTVVDEVPVLHQVFSLGSTNKIAGWNFSDDSIYLGVRKNQSGTFTDSTGSITIGTNGLRGFGWRIDSNGDVSLGGGRFAYTKSTDTAKIAGWKLGTNYISSNHFYIASESGISGIYMSPTDLSSVAVGNLLSQITENSGIYITAQSDSIALAGYKNGACEFKIGTAGNSIAGWSFNSTAFYITSDTIDANNHAAENAFVIKSTGIYANKWYILADGSGSLANGGITWNANGDLTISSITDLAAYSEYLERLAQFLPAGDTNIYGGLVLTSRIGVRNEAGDIVAAFNGEYDSDRYFVNDDHGLLMFASGFNGLSNAGSATTRIYSDGTVFSNLFVCGEENGKRVEISDSTISIFNDDGEQGALFNGDIINDPASTFGSETGSANFNSEANGRRSASTSTYSGTESLTRTITSISQVFYSSSPILITFTGSLYAYASSSRPQDNDTPRAISGSTSPGTNPSIEKSYASCSIQIIIMTYRDAACTQLLSERNIASTSVSAMGSGLAPTQGNTDNRTGTFTGPVRIKTANGGYHVIKIRTYGTIEGLGEIEVSWGTQGTNLHSGGTAFSASYISDYYIGKYFGNGYCLGNSATSFATAYYTMDHGVQFEVRNGSYGLRVSDIYGVQTYTGTNYVSATPIVFSGRFYIYGTGPYINYTGNFYRCRGFTFNSCTRTSTGLYQIKINLPSASVNENDCHVFLQEIRDDIEYEMQTSTVTSITKSGTILTINVLTKRIHTQGSWAAKDYVNHSDMNFYLVMIYTGN